MVRAFKASVAAQEILRVCGDRLIDDNDREWMLPAPEQFRKGSARSLGINMAVFSNTLQYDASYQNRSLGVVPMSKCSSVLTNKDAEGFLPRALAVLHCYVVAGSRKAAASRTDEEELPGSQWSCV